jgi:hypothetical protein
VRVRVAACALGWCALVLGAAAPCPAGLEEPVDGSRLPTAGLLGHREFRVQGRAGPESSVLTGARLGVGDVLQLGVFYGAQHLIDDEAVTFNDRVGFEVRARVVEEDRFPALAVGFSSQGWGEFDEAAGRYERKSPGFYLVASKNWGGVLGDLSLHAGASYSLETDDGEDAPDAFAAVDWTVARRVSFLCDADAARNDDHEDGRWGEGGPYVDAGVRAVLGETLSLMLVFSDLAGSTASGGEAERELEIVFANRF